MCMNWQTDHKMISQWTVRRRKTTELSCTLCLNKQLRCTRETALLLALFRNVATRSWERWDMAFILAVNCDPVGLTLSLHNRCLFTSSFTAWMTPCPQRTYWDDPVSSQSDTSGHQHSFSSTRRRGAAYSLTRTCTRVHCACTTYDW